MSTPQSRRLEIAAAVFGIVLGIFLSRVFAFYRPAPYQPDWGTAQWIEPASSSAVAYYRYQFMVEARPLHAYLQLAAPDSFTVYLNGYAVGSDEYTSTLAYDLYDLSAAIQPGRNVLAVRVERKTYPGTAAMRAALVWQDITGSRAQAVSGPGWKVVPYEERQINGMVHWYQPLFQDLDWPRAAPHEETTGWVHPAHRWATPQLIEALPVGSWIRTNGAAALGVSFRRGFELDAEHIEHAWLGVSARAPYTLLVNRARVAATDSINSSMSVYDVGPFLRRGDNTVQVDTGGMGHDEDVAVSLLVQSAGGVQNFSSGADWEVSTDEAGWTAPVVQGRVGTIPVSDATPGTRLPALNFVELPFNAERLLRVTLRALPWVLGCWAALGLAIGLLRLAVRTGRAAVDAVLSLPLAFGSLLLGVGFLLSFDVRLTPTQVFTLPAALAVAGLTAAWMAWLALELAVERR